MFFASEREHEILPKSVFFLYDIALSIDSLLQKCKIKVEKSRIASEFMEHCSLNFSLAFID